MEGHMPKKTIGIVLIIIGVILALVSVLADVIGIGNKAGFGWQQLLGTVVGIVVLLVGVWLARSKTNQT
jgi:uncharacterized membrane protein